MRSQSLAEYKIICDLTKSVVEDISKYASLIFTSSGAVIVGIGAFVTSYLNNRRVAASNTLDIMPIYLSFSSAAISIITLLMLLIVLYKCESHNRLVGYRTLLSSEVIVHMNEVDHDFSKEWHSFDYCMGKMRAITGDQENTLEEYRQYIPLKQGRLKDNSDDDVIASVYQRYSFIKKKIKFGRNTRSIDTVAIQEHSLKLVKQMMLMSVESSSWAFPTYVTASVLYIVGLECLFAISMALFEAIQYNTDASILSTLALIFGYITIVWHLCSKIWFRYCQIMVGSKTIDSYVWRFMLIRCRYLSEISRGKLEPYYI